MKRYFITGLICLLPFAITLFLFLAVMDFITDPFLSLAESFLGKWPVKHPTFSVIASRILVLAFLVFLTFLLGFLTRKYLGAYLIKCMERLFQKIPFLRGIFRFSQDITKIVLSSEGNLFTQTVLIPFPQSDSLAIGLISHPPPSCITAAAKAEIGITVFIPTSPHPISGFLLFTSQSSIKPIDMSTEDAFKYIISCGTVNDIKQPPDEDLYV